MVKDKRGNTTRLILGVLIVLLVAGVTVAGLLAARRGTQAATPMRTTVSMPSSPTTAAPVAATAPAATTPAPAASTTAPAATAPAETTPAKAATPVKTTPTPLGVRGSWKLVFSDSFDGSALNRKVWNAHDGWTNQNGVSDSLGNVAVRSGRAILTLASGSSGAELGTLHFSLKVGDFAQARIKFAGNGHTIYNWPAFWASGPEWPHGGENDIAEGFGALTINYHSPSMVEHSGAVPGDWSNRFHTYGIYRGRTYSSVYWDGKLIRTYRTYDDGQPETLLLTLGAGTDVRTGSAGAMIVDYVRAWRAA
jgi:beta-glucanase (GH16 family)